MYWVTRQNVSGQNVSGQNVSATKRIGDKKNIGDKTYRRQNLSATNVLYRRTARIGRQNVSADKTYRWTKHIGRQKLSEDTSQSVSSPDKTYNTVAVKNGIIIISMSTEII
jgi:hypothetical protein